MHPVIQSRFRCFNEPFEGVVPYMYLDVRGLVTVGVGNLIDPLELATALPFRFKQKPGIASPGAPASRDSVSAEWQKIKSNASLKTAGHLACAPLTDLELADDAIAALIAERLRGNESIIKRQQAFQAFATWPADAQLGLLSMAWAMGPGGFSGFPKFSAACATLNFGAAAGECKLNEEGNPGLHPRNAANFVLFSNAAAVLTRGLDRAKLFYPRAL